MSWAISDSVWSKLSPVLAHCTQRDFQGPYLNPSFKRARTDQSEASISSHSAPPHWFKGCQVIQISLRGLHPGVLASGRNLGAKRLGDSSLDITFGETKFFQSPRAAGSQQARPPPHQLPGAVVGEGRATTSQHHRRQKKPGNNPMKSQALHSRFPSTGKLGPSRCLRGFCDLSLLTVC